MVRGDADGEGDWECIRSPELWTIFEMVGEGIQGAA